MLGSKTRIKLLNLLLFNPKNKYYLRELEKLLKVNINAVRREIKNLLELGLVLGEKRGNQKLYFINERAPIYNELKSIFLKTENIGSALKKNLEKIGMLNLAFIYGSYARGSVSITSDIDICVVGDIDEKELVRVIGESEKILMREINYVLFTEKEFRKRIKNKEPFVTEIIKRPKIIICGGLNEFK